MTRRGNERKELKIQLICIEIQRNVPIEHAKKKKNGKAQN
jgi:hypothetical protein